MSVDVHRYCVQGCGRREVLYGSFCGLCWVALSEETRRGFIDAARGHMHGSRAWEFLYGQLKRGEVK